MKLHRNKAFRVHYGRNPGEYVCIAARTADQAKRRFRQQNPGFTPLSAYRA